MLHNGSRVWRFIGTSLSFAAFGIGSVVVGLIIFPMLYLFPVSKKRKQQISRNIIRWCFWVFIHGMRILGVLSFTIRGDSKLQHRTHLLIVANHPTLLDVVFILSFANNPTCVIKSGVWKNPFMHFIVKSAQFICNDGDAEKLIYSSVKTLECGDSLIVFPEGTRTNLDKKMEMKRGAAQIALLSKAQVVPIVIRCTPIALSKQQHWYDIPKSRPHFDISVENDMQLAAFMDTGLPRGQAARNLTDFLENYFLERITEHGSIGKRN